MNRYDAASSRPPVPLRHRLAALGLGGVLAVSLSACGSAASSSQSAASTGSAASAASVTAVAQPSGMPAPPGGGSADLVTGTGLYTVDGTSETSTGQSYETSTADQSAVLVSGGGSLTMTDPTITTTGDSSSSDSSSFNGLNAGVLVNADSSATIDAGTVTTSGAGANGVFAYGDGATVTIEGTTISATGQYAHGIMTAGGGAITATDLTVTTAGKNSAAIATDRGGGTIAVTGGTYTTAGGDSPGIYSTGAVTVSDATITSTGSEAAVIEGSNTVTVTDSTLSTSHAGRGGVMIYQSMSGDADGSEGVFRMSGGLLADTASDGPLFFVTNTTGEIDLDGVDLTAASGVLLSVAADQWGTAGSNGGHAVLKATGQDLAGDVVVDGSSSVAITLSDGSTLTGAIDSGATASSAALSLDDSSNWVVTADSHLTSLTGAVISGTTIANIVGNGYTVTYDAADSANADLGGATYTLSGGGTLTPAS